MTALKKWDSALCGFVLLISIRALAGDILLLKSQNSTQPYSQALQGFRNIYSVEDLDLKGGSESQRKQFLRRISDSKPRLIVAVGSAAVEVARAGPKGISVIFMMVSNPVGQGFTGDNIAGVSLDIPISRQFAKFKELLPTLKTIGVIYPSKNSAMPQEVQAAAKQLEIEPTALPVNSPNEVPTAFTLMNETIDALWMVPDETFLTSDWFKFLLKETNRRRLPFLTTSENFVEAGALAAVIPNYTDIGRQCAELVKEIESGKKKPSEVGTVPPDKVNWVLNEKTAKEIGLTLPARVRDSASKIYSK